MSESRTVFLLPIQDVHLPGEFLGRIGCFALIGAAITAVLLWMAYDDGSSRLMAVFGTLLGILIAVGWLGNMLASRAFDKGSRDIRSFEAIALEEGSINHGDIEVSVRTLAPIFAPIKTSGGRQIVPNRQHFDTTAMTKWASSDEVTRINVAISLEVHSDKDWTLRVDGIVLSAPNRKDLAVKPTLAIVTPGMRSRMIHPRYTQIGSFDSFVELTELLDNLPIPKGVDRCITGYTARSPHGIANAAVNTATQQAIIGEDIGLVLRGAALGAAREAVNTARSSRDDRVLRSFARRHNAFESPAGHGWSFHA